jgi:hypothetical protein
MATFVLLDPYPVTSVGPVSADLDDYVENPMREHGDLIAGGTAGIATRVAGNTSTTLMYLTQTGDGSIAGDPTWVGVGPQGTTGSQGIQGTQGTQGIQGESIQGIQGLLGIQGLQGIQGISIQGSSGSQGMASTTIQGIQGIVGSQGMLGATIQGIQGVDASASVQGIIGVMGIDDDLNGAIQGIQGIIATSQNVAFINSVNLYIPLLPTSSAGLELGMVYNDGGILKITI